MPENKENDFGLNHIYINIIYNLVLERYQPVWDIGLLMGIMKTFRLNFNADILI